MPNPNKNSNRKNIVLIAAAGNGSRMNSHTRKQFLIINEKPMLAFTLQTFDENSRIDGIVLVSGKEDIEICKEQIIGNYKIKKIIDVVEGGNCRQKSVYNGLKAITELGLENVTVLIHDAARPFVSERIIAENIEMTERFGAACTAVPVKDTIKSAGRDGMIMSTLDRNSLYYVQTPQSFKLELIFDAHKKALSDGFTGTDDAVLLERVGADVRIVTGSYSNIKITTSEDLYMAEIIASKGAWMND